MFYIKYISCAIILLGIVQTQAQNNFKTLSESTFNINHKVSETYKMNFALKSRIYLYRDANISLKQRQLDLLHFSTFPLNYNHSLSFGIQYRNRDWFENSINELRLTQQFNITKKYLNKRFGHRFRIEERILNDLIIFRMRYRFTVDFPLNGRQLDIKETYLVISAEVLNSVTSFYAPELDQRTTVQMGWMVSKNLKLQTGIEYRFEALNIKTEQKLFLLSSAILKI